MARFDGPGWHFEFRAGDPPCVVWLRDLDFREYEALRRQAGAEDGEPARVMAALLEAHIERVTGIETADGVLSWPDQRETILALLRSDLKAYGALVSAFSARVVGTGGAEGNSSRPSNSP